jgi:hypothetical protein
LSARAWFAIVVVTVPVNQHDGQKMAEILGADSVTIVDVAGNLAAIKQEISETARAAGREPDDVALLAVSKIHGSDRIRAALEAGHRLFGENRVQEAQDKWPELKAAYPDVTLHLIGHLQTNKAEDAVLLFDVIETVDRPKLARALAKAMTKCGRRPDLLIQVNTGEEPQKGGVAPSETDAFVAFCRDELALPVKGLMCLPPLDEEPAPHFALLRKIADRNGLSVVSMGMSADYPIAIEFGATVVRVGTAVFGARPK